MTAPGHRELKALQDLFAQEVNLATCPPEERLRQIVRLPKQRAERMKAKGWILPASLHVGRDAFGSIIVPMWSLTPLGHYLYCEWCAEQPEEEPPDA